MYYMLVWKYTLYYKASCKVLMKFWSNCHRDKNWNRLRVNKAFPGIVKFFCRSDVLNYYPRTFQSHYKIPCVSPIKSRRYRISSSGLVQHWQQWKPESVWEYWHWPLLCMRRHGQYWFSSLALIGRAVKRELLTTSRPGKRNVLCSSSMNHPSHRCMLTGFDYN